MLIVLDALRLHVTNLPAGVVSWRLRADKKSPWDAILVLGQRYCSQTAQWYAPQTEWYLISPSRHRAEVWQTNGFAVSRMFSGGTGWAEIQRCLCVVASAEHNKTLWGMNQTQSYRDTKVHMLIRSVNFPISPPLSSSYFFTLPSFLSYKETNGPFLLTAAVVCLSLQYVF